MDVTITQVERNKIMNSVQNQIKEKVNPYFIKEIEKAIKLSLNPNATREEVKFSF